MRKFFTTRIRYLHLLFVAVATMLSASLVAADIVAPQAIIEENSTRLIDALRKQSAQIKQDPQVAYRLVDDIVLPHIDFTRVSQLVLGKYWRDASDQQRAKFRDEFSKLLIRTYVTAMVEFSDKIISNAENVKFLPFRGDLKSDDVVVRMEINLDGRPTVSVNYSMFENGTGWKIYDLSVEGISLASTYRTTFATEIKRGGIDNLISKLEAKNASK